MTKVQISIDIREESLQCYEVEARREGVTLQSLLERVVNGLIRDMQREEEEGTDHPIIAS